MNSNGIQSRGTPLISSPICKRPSSAANANSRITIWHRTQRRKIAGNAAPLRKNLARYLEQHKQCELYVDQDRVRAQEARSETRCEGDGDQVFPSTFDLDKFISLKNDDDLWKCNEFYNGVLPPLRGCLEMPN